MAVVQVKEPVTFRGKPEYRIDSDIMPTPDGIVFRSAEMLTPEGLITITLVPWLNIVSITSDVGPDFFDVPQPAGEDENGPGELS